jgi:hypothetical protein
VGLYVTDQLLIRFFGFVRYWRKQWEYNETVHQLFIDFSVEGSFVIEFRVPMKLVRLIKICLN